MNEFSRISRARVVFKPIMSVSFVLSGHINQHSTLGTGDLYKMVSASQTNSTPPYLQLLTDGNSLALLGDIWTVD